MKIRFQSTIQINDQSQKVEYCYLKVQNIVIKFQISIIYNIKTEYYKFF
jgi:hypothetical protein